MAAVVCKLAIHGRTELGCPVDVKLQRAEGVGRLALVGDKSGNRLVDLFQQPPIHIMFPGSNAKAFQEAVLVNSMGGIAGGDHLDLHIRAHDNAAISVTSQAAERVYRALGTPARVSTFLTVGESAQLAWLPQETILFNGARLVRSMNVELSSGSELLALEWLILGRRAYGEKLVAGELSDTWRVRRDGRLVWVDRFRVTDEVMPFLGRDALLGDSSAIGTLIYSGPHLEARLECVREAIARLQCRAAVTLIAGLIVVRVAARAAADLKRALQNLIRHFGHHRTPSPFAVPKMWSC
jgi:urease accessory protein